MRAGVVEIERGIKVRGMELWLDATRVRPVGFVSHAHGDHVAAHRRLICSPNTARLLHRVPASRLAPQPFGQRFRLDGATLQLLPAGHILGSAQIVIERRGRRIVYTGDFRLRPSLTAEPIEIPPCDILIMEATFGQPRFRFPDRQTAALRLQKFVEETMEDRCVPVVVAYVMGKSQEAAKILGDLGYRVCLPRGSWEILERYRSAGVRFKNCEPAEGDNFYGKVLIVPPFLVHGRRLARIRHKRTVFLSGWAMDRGAAERFGVDDVIPMSDHADFDELIEYVTLSRPEQVYTVHGSPHLAAHLRARGFATKHLEPSSQLALF